VTAPLAGFDVVSPFRAAVQYVSPRERRLTRKETRIRDVAYSLKGGCPKPEGGHVYRPGAMEAAATAMAPLVPLGPSRRVVLVPIPGATGCTRGNRELAQAIALLLCAKPHVKVRVADLLTRSSPVESLHSRRHRGLAAPRGIRAHRMIMRPGVDVPDPTEYGPLVLIDNVVTTGSTFAAARDVLGGGIGLAYAQASEVLSPDGKGPARPSLERGRAP
jgi:hypothetical protein